MMQKKQMRPIRACSVCNATIILALAMMASQLAAEPLKQASYTVTDQKIIDFKSVLATVRSRDQIEARVRTPGTITHLNVDEGTQVKAGQQIATVVDDKLHLRIKGINARIRALETRVTIARSELERSQELTKRKVSPQTRLESAQNAYDTAIGDLKAARTERSVIEEQSNEGKVLAPADGRVLKVPVTVGSVVLPGESIATIAANEYLLRLELPERHARFIRKDDVIRVGARGLGNDEKPVTTGHIVQVYPQLSDGRVIADAHVDGLGNYFIGERTLVWISAGSRNTLMVPRRFVFQRYSLDYVKIADKDKKSIDVVVQLGQETRSKDGDVFVEVLAGLRPGDVVMAP